MKFLENLSEFTGGARGGLGALGEVLAAAALGEATAQPGSRTGAGAARGFAAGVSGLGDAFARGRGMRDKERVRAMAVEKLKDPNLGAAERDLYTAIASGNTAALDLFDETLAARASDRADRDAERQSNYYAARLAALGGEDALTNDEIRHNRNVLEARKRLIENPTLFDQLDLGDPDSLTGKAMDTFKGVPDPEHGLIHRWLATDALERGDQGALMASVRQELGEQGLGFFADRYGLGGMQEGAPETGGAAAEAADQPQGGGAGGVIDAVAGSIPEVRAPHLMGNIAGMVDSLFGTDFVQPYRDRAAAPGKIDSLLGELDAAARGIEPRAPSIVGGGVLVPDDQIDRAFQAITAPSEPRRGRDLLAREDALRPTTGPTSRWNSIVQSVFPAMREAQAPMLDTLSSLDASMAQIPGAVRSAGSELGTTLGRVPGDFMDALRSGARPGAYQTTVDARGAGRAAQADYPYPLPFQAFYLSPEDRGERYQNLIRDLGWGQ